MTILRRKKKGGRKTNRSRDTCVRVVVCFVILQFQFNSNPNPSLSFFLSFSFRSDIVSNIQCHVFLVCFCVCVCECVTDGRNNNNYVKKKMINAPLSTRGGIVVMNTLVYRIMVRSNGGSRIVLLSMYLLTLGSTS